MQEPNTSNSGPSEAQKHKNWLLIALALIALAAVLTWAVATVFEVAFAKALAMVVLGLFLIIIALFSSGLA